MCGVFGVFGHPEAANITYLGLHALQHRGQESAGIVSSDESRLTSHRGMGQVIDVFSPQQLERLTGPHAIGHVRYSTSGGSFLKNAQPIAVAYTGGSLAIAHNGNLTNADTMRTQLEERGSIFQSDSDTEVIVHLVAHSKQRRLEDRLADALAQVHGAYSLMCLTEREMIAVRDPFGIRPLCLGRFPGDDGAWVVASEPASFDLIGAEFVRDIAPGEMLICDREGLRSTWPFAPRMPKACVFEYIYFARPDAVLDGISVYEARKNLGRALARRDKERHNLEADVVIPVPDSGLPATIGYSEAAKLPFEMGLVRSHYVGRTFIEPEARIRHFGVRLKLNPLARVLRGKRVVVVDDSIVRGTTSRKIVKMLRNAGAREVHMRVSSPQVTWPCYYGIDTPTRSELIAPSHTLEEINQYITSDSLDYLSLDETLTAVLGAREDAAVTDQRSALVAASWNAQHPGASGPEGAHANGTLNGAHAGGHQGPSNGIEPRAIDSHRRLPVCNLPSAESFCHACFDGNYPVKFQEGTRARQMRLLDL
jgi:amidophosphoribosyltransferase